MIIFLKLITGRHQQINPIIIIINNNYLFRGKTDSE